MSFDDILDSIDRPGRKPKVLRQEDKNVIIAQDTILDDLEDLRTEARLIAQKYTEECAGKNHKVRHYWFL